MGSSVTHLDLSIQNVKTPPFLEVSSNFDRSVSKLVRPMRLLYIKIISFNSLGTNLKLPLQQLYLRSPADTQGGEMRILNGRLKCFNIWSQLEQLVDIYRFEYKYP